jgi:hypothetical protein
MDESAAPALRLVVRAEIRVGAAASIAEFLMNSRRVVGWVFMVFGK